MTEGNPISLLIRFSIPLLLGNIFQQLYNLVDTMIVGRYLGITALTQVGATSSVNYLVMGFVTGVCAGFSIPLAQEFGAGNYGKMRRYMFNGCYLAAGLALVLTVGMGYFCRDIFVLVKTPEEILPGACSYMRIIFAGLPFTFLYNMTAGIIRSMGDSKTPFYFLAVATALNIGLDLLFVLVFHLGIEGAAFATVLAQSISGISCLLYMKRKCELLCLKKEEKKCSWKCVQKLMSVGLPLGLQSSVTAIGAVLLQSAVNSLGLTFVAAYTAVIKIEEFSICPYTALDTAMVTYTSQNYGAGKLHRVDQGIRAGMKLYGVYSITAALLLIFAGDKIAWIFVDPSETEVLNCVRLFFRCCGMFYLAVVVLNTLRSVIQGLGYGSVSILAGLCELFTRSAIAIWLVPKFGYIAVCFSDAAAWVLAGICVAVMYARIRGGLERKTEKAGAHRNI